MKIFFYTLLIILCIWQQAKCQIPYAVKQPKWYLPIYFEDATPKKDTVYLGYDPDAPPWQGNNNAIYGGHMKSAPNDFSASTYYWTNGVVDSIARVCVLDSSSFGYFSVNLNKVVYPLAITSDITFLRSSNLPFEDQFDTPSAQMEVSFGSTNSYVAYPTGLNCGLWIVTFSDTMQECSCCTQDKLILNDIFNNPNPQSHYLTIRIKPWTGYEPVGNDEIHNKENYFYPNPATSKINIIVDWSIVSRLVIYNSLGEEMLFMNQFNKLSEIDISTWSLGLYTGVFYLKNGENLPRHKLIKNHQ